MLRTRLRAIALLGGLTLTATACGGADAGQGAPGDGPSGTIQIDGSSTVAPLSEAAAELFQEEFPGVRVVVGTSGTGGGFEKFCAGSIDIADASRPIKPEEAELCKANGVAYEEIVVANDGLAVVVNPDNDWVDCLTVEQLNRIWGPDSDADSWRDIDPSFPDEELRLFGPGTDSGTFDYFTDEINGKSGASRTDYQPSEDDNFVVQGIRGSAGATGYIGLSYVEENSSALRAVAIDGGDGCVEPSAETVLDGSYTPLGRPLFVYASSDLVSRPEGRAFLEFYIENDEDIAAQALYIPLSDEQQSLSEAKVDSLAGTPS